MKPQSALGRIWNKGPQPRETFLLWLGPHQLWSENSSWEQLFSPIKMVEFWCWEFHGNLHQDIFYLWGFFHGDITYNWAVTNWARDFTHLQAEVEG